MWYTITIYVTLFTISLFLEHWFNVVTYTVTFKTIRVLVIAIIMNNASFILNSFAHNSRVTIYKDNAIKDTSLDNCF